MVDATQNPKTPSREVAACELEADDSEEAIDRALKMAKEPYGRLMGAAVGGTGGLGQFRDGFTLSSFGAWVALTTLGAITGVVALRLLVRLLSRVK